MRPCVLAFALLLALSRAGDGAEPSDLVSWSPEGSWLSLAARATRKLPLIGQ